jgi:hypothetical protein
VFSIWFFLTGTVRTNIAPKAMGECQMGFKMPPKKRANQLIKSDPFPNEFPESFRERLKMLQRAPTHNAVQKIPNSTKEFASELCPLSLCPVTCGI